MTRMVWFVDCYDSTRAERGKLMKYAILSHDFPGYEALPLDRANEKAALEMEWATEDTGGEQPKFMVAWYGRAEGSAAGDIGYIECRVTATYYGGDRWAIVSNLGYEDQMPLAVLEDIFTTIIQRAKAVMNDREWETVGKVGR